MTRFAMRLFKRFLLRVKPLYAWERAHRLSAKYDRQTVAVMQKVLTKDSNCIDVGCYEGRILREILNYAPCGRHFAFEPIPRLAQALKETFLPFENVQVFDVALSDAAGTSTFQHVISAESYSGLRRRRYDRPREDVVEIRVKTGLLDDLIPQHISIHFIKVDVEGAELQVFRGGVQTISRTKPVIVFEHGLGAADYFGVKPDEVYDLLVNVCGLRVSLMDRFLSGCASLSRDAFRRQFHTNKNFYFVAYP